MNTRTTFDTQTIPTRPRQFARHIGQGSGRHTFYRVELETAVLNEARRQLLAEPCCWTLRDLVWRLEDRRRLLNAHRERVRRVCGRRPPAFLQTNEPRRLPASQGWHKRQSTEAKEQNHGL